MPSSSTDYRRRPSSLLRQNVAIIATAPGPTPTPSTIKGQRVSVVWGSTKAARSWRRPRRDGLECSASTRLVPRRTGHGPLPDEEPRNRCNAAEIAPHLSAARCSASAHGSTSASARSFLAACGRVMIAPRVLEHTVRWEYQNGQAFQHCSPFTQDARARPASPWRGPMPIGGSAAHAPAP